MPVVPVTPGRLLHRGAFSAHFAGFSLKAQPLHGRYYPQPAS